MGEGSFRAWREIFIAGRVVAFSPPPLPERRSGRGRVIIVHKLIPHKGIINPPPGPHLFNAAFLAYRLLDIPGSRSYNSHRPVGKQVRFSVNTMF